MAAQRASELTRASRHLLQLLSRVGFGRIENLLIRGGQPKWVPKPRVLRSVKLGIRTPPEPPRRTGDFQLRRQHIELLDLLDQLQDGTIARLDIVDGLPVTVLVEDHCSSGDPSSRLGQISDGDAS